MKHKRINFLKGLILYALVLALIGCYSVVAYFVFSHQNSYAYTCYYKNAETKYWAGNNGLDIEYSKTVLFTQNSLAYFPNGEQNKKNELLIEKEIPREIQRYNLQYLSKDFYHSISNGLLEYISTSSGSLYFRLPLSASKIYVEIDLINEDIQREELQVAHNGQQVDVECFDNMIALEINYSEENKIYLGCDRTLMIKSMTITKVA